MKRIIPIIVCALMTASSGLAAFPTNTSTKTINLDKLKPDFSDFRFDWRGYDSQDVTFTINTTSGTPLNMTGMLASFQATKQVAGGANTAFITKATTETTITLSNITFTVLYTNVPPDGVYKAELFLQDASSANVTRSLARGTIKVEQSLYANDASDFTFPSLTTSFADLSDVVITTAAQGDVLYRGATYWNNLVAGTSGYVLTTAGASANPSWTAKTTDTDTTFTNTVRAGSGVHLTGAITSGDNTIAHSNVSSQASVDNSGGTVIQDITMDAIIGGHATAITSLDLDTRYYTETEIDAGYVPIAGGWTYLIGQTSTWDTALQNVVEDTTPGLGGTLDANGFAVSNAVNLTLTNNVDQGWQFLIDGNDDFQIKDTGNGAQPFTILDGAQNASIYIRTSGRVGINDSNPSVALDVVGAGLFSTTLGVTGLSTLTGGANLAGNLDLGGNDITSANVITGTNFNIRGTALLDDDASLQIDATADGMADDKYNGITIKGKNFGETVAAFEVVELQADAKFDKADASTGSGLFPAWGIAVTGGNDTDAAIVMVKGVVRNESWTGLTVAGPVYLSETAGGVTQTAPSDSGDCIQIIGFALSDSEIYFDFSRPYSTVE